MKQNMESLLMQGQQPALEYTVCWERADGYNSSVERKDK